MDYQLRRLDDVGISTPNPLRDVKEVRIAMCMILPAPENIQFALGELAHHKEDNHAFFNPIVSNERHSDHPRSVPESSPINAGHDGLYRSAPPNKRK